MGILEEMTAESQSAAVSSENLLAESSERGRAASPISPAKRRKPNLSRKEWASSEVASLITAFESKPCLWDLYNRQRRDPVAKEEAVREIAALFGTTSEQVRRKFNNLRSQFNNEYKKCNTSQSGGLYVSKWPHFQSLMFLETNIINRRHPFQQMMNRGDRSQEIKNEQGADEELKTYEDYLNGPVEGGVEAERKRRTVSKWQLCEGGSSSQQGPLQYTLCRRGDQFDVFGAYIASEMRSLSDGHLRRRLKRKIQRALLEITEEDDSAHCCSTDED